MDEICHELLKALDVVGLSWLTLHCNTVWTSETVPLEWHTGVIVPLFKKGDQRMCSNYWGDHTLQLLWVGVLQGAGEESLAANRTSDSREAMWFLFWPWNTGPDLAFKNG